jgi:hypothetical protein
MGRAPVFDPLTETEYLVEGTLAEAELDGTLEDLVSTYDPSSDRLTVGMSRPGPRVLDFAPLLRVGDAPFNTAMRRLLEVCQRVLDLDVEIEVAVDWGPGRDRPLMSLVQMRPMVVADAEVDLAADDLTEGEVLLSTRRAVGHGVELVEDVVYVRPDTFDPATTRLIAEEIGERNTSLLAEGRPYLLIGFGRWGTTDPWGGIPVRWEQVGGARVMVEVSLPNFRAIPSQGSHFFHNVTSLQVLYLGLDEEEGHRLRWDWLEEQTEIAQTTHVRHVRFLRPLRVEVDGKTRRGRALRAEG